MIAIPTATGWAYGNAEGRRSAEPGGWRPVPTAAGREAPTLCAGWRVRDVVAHMLSYDELDGRGLVRRFVKGRFLPDRINAVGLAEYNSRV